VAYIGNTPQQSTVLHLEQRKSYALMLRFMDMHRRLADLTNCTVRLVVKSLPLPTSDPGDGANIIVNSTATITDALLGECQFDLQSTDLDVAEGEYPYVIVLVTPGGYSIVVVKGVVAVLPNTEWSSLDSWYEPGITTGSPIALEITLRGTNVLDVISSAYVPPGFTWMSQSDKDKLDGLDEASSLLPPGGTTNQVMGKASNADYDFRWITMQAFDGTLSAAGQPAGMGPLSDGLDGWAWAYPFVDWAAVDPGQAGYIHNQPVLGTAASADVESFAAAAHTHDGADIASGVIPAEHVPRLIDLDGVSYGTEVPTGGVDGDLYLRYT
jgi:hypothetical protein